MSVKVCPPNDWHSRWRCRTPVSGLGESRQCPSWSRPVGIAQRRSQDFLLGGPIFRDLRRPTRFGGGGGVVAEIFRERRKPGRFSGGGVVAQFFGLGP